MRRGGVRFGNYPGRPRSRPAWRSRSASMVLLKKAMNSSIRVLAWGSHAVQPRRTSAFACSRPKAARPLPAHSRRDRHEAGDTPACPALPDPTQQPGHISAARRLKNWAAGLERQPSQKPRDAMPCVALPASTSKPAPQSLGLHPTRPCPGSRRVPLAPHGGAWHATLALNTPSGRHPFDPGRMPSPGGRIKAHADGGSSVRPWRDPATLNS